MRQLRQFPNLIRTVSEQRLNQLCQLPRMLDAARTIQDFTTGVSLDDYLADRKLQLVVERLIEIIGEAARLVSEEWKAQHAAIPGRKSSRNETFSHTTTVIMQDRIWRVATTHAFLNLSRTCTPIDGF